MFEDWKKDDTGNLSVNPLVGYSTAVAAETAIAVKLDYLVEGDQFERPSGTLQLVITPPQAQALSRALLTAADKILKMKLTSKPS
jgi:hypothetical protein